jgi:2-methylfumaryl-CoA isomerase
MYDLLEGMRVVEAAAFIAGPSCGLHLAQMGADVIRIDQIGGGPDFRRWPLASEGGASLYWEGLNKAKRSGSGGAHRHGPRTRRRPVRHQLSRRGVSLL